VPVLEGGRVVGLLDESDLLLKVHTDPTRFHALAKDTMMQTLETLPPSAGLERLTSVLDRGLVAIIADDQEFYGLITRFDLLNHLRRTLQ
jgi:cystathionine beta-synthase